MRTILTSPYRVLVCTTLVLAMSQTSCRGTSTGFQHQAVAEVIETAEQLIGGPAAEGRPGDILLHNAWVRAIIQTPRDSNAPDGVFGGNLIDLDVARRPLAPGQDRLRELVPWFGPGHGAKPDTVRIADDGSATGQAIVEVIAHDVRLRSVDRYLEQSGQSIAALPGDPSAAIAVDVRTRYILGADDQAILIETALINQGNEAIQIPVGDLMSVRPDLEQFVAAGAGQGTGRPSPGFAPWPERIYNQTSLIGWTSPDISYVWVPFGQSPYEQAAATACALPAGHQTLCVPGAAFSSGQFTPVTGAWDGAADGNSTWLNIPPRGTGMAVWRRYVGVSEQGIAPALSSVMSDRDQVRTTVTVADSSGAPVTGAEVAIASNNNGTWYPWLHGWTDSEGKVSFPLHRGLWRAYAWTRGHGTTDPTGPDRQDFQIAAIGADPISFALTIGDAGTVEVFTQDQARQPLPAHVVLLGRAPVAEISASSTTATTTLHAFLPGPERLIPAAARADVIDIPGLDVSALPDPLDVVGMIDTDASGAGRITVAPGRYVAIGWRGADYGATATVIDVTANRTARALLTVPQIQPRTAHLWADLLHDSSEGHSRTERAAIDGIAASSGVGFVGVADTQIIAPVAHTASNVTSVGGLIMGAPGMGSLAAFSLTPAPLPLRNKPIPVATETVTPAVSRGGAPADIDPETGEWVAPVDQLAQAMTRATTPRATLLIDPSRWIDELGITFAFANGEDAALTTDNGALWSDAWTVMLTRPRQYGMDGLWRDLNVAFAFWNIGRPALLAASSQADGDQVPAALPVATRVGAAAASPATTVVSALETGDLILTNQASMELSIKGTLWNLAGTATVLDVFGPAHPGELLVIRRDNFPTSGTSFALDLTATITIRSPAWAKLDRVELFDTAAFVTGPAVDLSTVTAASWSITEAAWNAAITSTSIVVADQGSAATATSGQYVELTWNWTRRITATTLTAAETTDLWFAARAWGETGLFPVALDRDGAGLPPFAVVNPVYVDLGGEAGLPFDDAWDGPCEAASSPSCPN